MNREQTKALLLAVRAVYPSLEVSSVLLGVWVAVLGRWSYEQAHAAVLAYLSEPHEFPPKPGEVNELCIRLARKAHGEPTAGAAWVEICGYASASMPLQKVFEIIGDFGPFAAAVRQVGYDRIRLANIENELRFIQRDFERYYAEAQERATEATRLELIAPLSSKSLPAHVFNLLEGKL